MAAVEGLNLGADRWRWTGRQDIPYRMEGCYDNMCHCKYTCTHYIYIFSILGILEYIVHTQCVYRIPILTADVFVEYSDFRKLGIPLGGSGILPEQMGRRLGFNVLGGIGEMATCSAPVWQENPDHQTW